MREDGGVSDRAPIAKGDETVEFTALTTVTRPPSPRGAVQRFGAALFGRDHNVKESVRLQDKQCSPQVHFFLLRQFCV